MKKATVKSAMLATFSDVFDQSTLRSTEGPYMDIILHDDAVSFTISRFLPIPFPLPGRS